MKQIILYLIISTSFLCAQNIVLKVPDISQGNHQEYYFELITKSLENNGYNVELIIETLPQQRGKIYLDKGIVSLTWMLESKERNNQYESIDVDLTNGLIGKRILFIPKGKQNLYNNIKNLKDLQNSSLLAALGNGWYDVDVWKANNLNYSVQPGNWLTIFKMLSNNRLYNYFPRGAIEILSESKKYIDLDIEKNLLLVYDRDYHFYLSDSGEYAGIKYKKILEDSLLKAKNDGFIDSLIDKYWGDQLKKLNIEDRIIINLNSPK